MSACVLTGTHFLPVSLPRSNWRPFKHALLLSLRSPLLLPSVPLTAKDLSSPASLLGWPEASFSKCPGRRVLIVCLSILYLSYCPCLLLRGPSLSKAVRQRFVVLSPLCFLVCVFILTVPQSVQKCRRVIGWACCFVPEKILIILQGSLGGWAWWRLQEMKFSQKGLDQNVWSKMYQKRYCWEHLFFVSFQKLTKGHSEKSWQMQYLATSHSGD